MEELMLSPKTASCEKREEFLISCDYTSAVLQSSQDEESKFTCLKSVQKRTERSGIYSFDNRKCTTFSSFKYIAFAVLLLSLNISEGWSKSIESAKKNITFNGLSKHHKNPPSYFDYNEAPITAQIIVEDDEMHETLSKMREPLVQAVKRGKYKCKKALRRGRYCMHGGTCEWIPEINQPRCKCISGWRGKRCREPVPDFTAKTNYRNALITALILSTFGVIAIILVGCICWRRVRYLRKHTKDVGVEKNMLKSDENENSKSDIEIYR